MKRICFQPRSGIAKGFSDISALMAATLGPNRGTILNAIGTGKPELLSDSGLIARRVTSIKGDTENMGAMIIRQAAMAMHERYLDGAAITAALAFALLKETHRLIAAGFNPMVLRRGIEQGVEAAGAALQSQAQPADTQQRLTQTAYTATHDQTLAEIVGEMFDLLGKTGAYVIDEYAAPLLDREYVEGGRWSARPAARELMPPAGADLIFDQPLIFVSADKIERFDQIQPVLEIALRTEGRPPLMIIASHVSHEVLNALTLNHTRGTLTVGVANLLASGDALTANLEDLALMAGAQIAAAERGSAPQHTRPDGLGRARRLILKHDSLTMISGNGNAVQLQRRVQELRARLRTLKTPDETWEQLRLRIARLSGGMAILKVGAQTFQERDEVKERAKKAVRVLETALEGGIVCGGGAAYLKTIPTVTAVKTRNAEEKAGVEALAHALKAPFLQLASSHAAPQVVLNEVSRRWGDVCFDVRSGQLVECWEAGLLDSAVILRAALETAASAAIMALTTDVVIVEA